MQHHSYQHQLNGYKYSFNRVNPYIDKQISENQTHTNLPQINTHLQSTKINNQNPSQSDTKLITLKPTNNQSNIIKNTKAMFYTKFQQNQKNKILIDLYLRKTKLNKIKLSPPKKSNDQSQLKLKLNHINTKHSQQQLFIHSTYLTQRNSNQHKNHQKIHHIHSSITNHVIESQTKSIQQPQKINNNEQKKKQLPKNRTKRSNNSIKLIRNFSQNKFYAYLTSPKQYSKIKASGTTPVQKISKFTASIEESFQNDDNSMNRNRKKNKHTKYLSLKINTEGSLDQYATDSQGSSFMNCESVSSRMDSVRNRIGALKYKSPRMIVSERNKKFLSRKQVPKIKLFSQQEEKWVIKEFYNQETNE